MAHDKFKKPDVTKMLIITLVVTTILFTIAIIVNQKRVDDMYKVPEQGFSTTFGTFVNPDNDDDTYSLLHYDGRSFIPYGTLRHHITKENIKGGIGVIHNGDPNANFTRIIQLNDTNDFLMLYDPNGIMNQPDFFRAVDTKGEQIEIPQYIQSLDYEFWE